MSGQGAPPAQPRRLVSRPLPESKAREMATYAMIRTAVAWRFPSRLPGPVHPGRDPELDLYIDQVRVDVVAHLSRVDRGMGRARDAIL